MNSNQREFALISVIDDGDQWVAGLDYKNAKHQVRLKKLRGIAPLAFIVSARDIADVFGDDLSLFMSSFLGELCGACLAGQENFPIREIGLDEIQLCASEGRPFTALIAKALRKV